MLYLTVVKRASQLNEFHLTWRREDMARQRVLRYDALLFENEWAWSKVHWNGTVFLLFLENKAEFQINLKRLISSYCLS